MTALPDAVLDRVGLFLTAQDIQHTASASGALGTRLKQMRSNRLDSAVAATMAILHVPCAVGSSSQVFVNAGAATMTVTLYGDYTAAVVFRRPSDVPWRPRYAVEAVAQGADASCERFVRRGLDHLLDSIGDGGGVDGHGGRVATSGGGRAIEAAAMALHRALT